MQKPYRWGVLSTAGISHNFAHAVAMLDTCEVAAVASRNLEQAQQWAKKYDVNHAFGSYQELLDSPEIDLIYVPLPNSMHAEWTIKALEAGKAVLCEKPMAVSVVEVERIRDASKKSGLLAVEAFMYRFHPLYKRIFDLIEEGRLGELLAIESQFCHALDNPEAVQYKAELAGGALLDLGCYCVNFSRLIFKEEPVHVAAFEKRGQVDETLMALMTFPSGAIARMGCSLTTVPRAYAEIVGSKAAIELTAPWHPGDTTAKLTLVEGSNRQDIIVDGANPYALQIADFVDAIDKNRLPKWTIDDAFENARVIDALFRSTKEGQICPL